jgi:hypothetical protein
MEAKIDNEIEAEMLRYRDNFIEANNALVDIERAHEWCWLFIPIPFVRFFIVKMIVSRYRKKMSKTNIF